MSCYRTRFRTRSRGLRGDVLINEYSLVQARELRSADYLVGPETSSSPWARAVIAAPGEFSTRVSVEDARGQLVVA